MRARAAVWFAVFAMASSMTPSHALHAQVLAGRVLEAGSDMPIGGAQLRLLMPNGVARGSIVSDSSGWFQLRIPVAGRYALTVQQIGYVPFTSIPLDVAAGRTITVEIRLGRDAIPLEPLIVTARRAELGRLAGFRERASTNTFGKFIKRDEIDRRPTANVSDFFRTMSAVHVLPVKRSGNPDAMTTYVIMMRGSGNEPAPGGADSSMQGMCAPAVYLDGTRIQQSASFPLDDLIQSGTLEGVEVYTSFTSVPPEYQTLGNCGAVLLWTRTSEGGGQRGWLRHAVGIAGGVGLLVLLLR